MKDVPDYDIKKAKVSFNEWICLIQLEMPVNCFSDILEMVWSPYRLILGLQQWIELPGPHVHHSLTQTKAPSATHHANSTTGTSIIGNSVNSQLSILVS